MSDNYFHTKKGILYGSFSFVIWGILPLYWKLLKEVSPRELLAHRIVWSLVFMILLLSSQKRLGKIVCCFHNLKIIILSSLCSIFICINWLVYIWAVNSGHVLEASMGYYINPLISVLFGAVIFKEQLNHLKITALILAAGGILVQTSSYGKIPWISISLAISFAIYGVLKKLIHFEAEVGIAMETLLISPFALGYIFLRQISGNGALGNISFEATILLLSSGIATAIPLLLFAKSTKMIKLSIVGFLQYVSPTISFLLGITVFHERISLTELGSFLMIWLAIILFILSERKMVPAS